MNPYAAALYDICPVWAQNLMVSGFAALLDRERYGGRYPEYRDLLARTENLSREELEAYQDERLRIVVSHAYETVPYYRRRFDERKLKPRDIRGRRDLHKIPLLKRDDIVANSDDLRSRDVSRRSLRLGRTSGTTGTPLTVGYDLDTVAMTYAVFDRHYRWAGCRMGRDGDRIAVARGNVIVPMTQTDPPFWRFNRRQKQLLLSSFHLSKTNLPVYFEALSRFRPDVIDGYPGTLYVLAKFLQSQGETFPLRAAITSSETLYDFQREVIEERFACPVYDYYALAERVVFANQCERHSRHHVAMEYGIAEVVDVNGQPNAPGVTGRLAGTGLHNMAMPLIRYVTTDMTSLREDTCECGRQLQPMEPVTTRADDLFTLKDGRMVSPVALTIAIKPLDSIEAAQLIQVEHDLVVVKIVAAAGYTPTHTQHVIRELKARLGDDVRIEMQFPDRIEPSPSGKLKWAISHVPLGI